MNKQERELAYLELRGEREILGTMREHYKVALDRVNAEIDRLAERTDLSGIRQKRYQEELAEQIGGIIDDLGSGSYASLEDYLKRCYEESFVGTLYNLQRQGIPLAFPLDQESMARSVTRTADDIKLSKRVYDNVGKMQQQVAAEITRGFADGSHVSEIADRIATETDIATEIKRRVAGRTDQALRRAMTIARTEKGRVRAESKLAAMHRAKEEGADIVKQWDATMDSRTREDHRKLNGQIRELDEDFEIRGVHGPAPHKMGRPEHDINCRCVCLQRARVALEMEEGLDYTKWDGVGQCYVDLSDSESYADFKAKYSLLTSDPGPARKESTFVPAKTIEEAQAFAQQFVDEGKFAPTFKHAIDYKGISLDVANQINRALDDAFRLQGVPKIAGIKAISPTSAQGKKVFSGSDAIAAYNFAEGGIFINKNILKSQTAFEKHAQEAREAFEFIRANLPSLSGKKRDVAERYVKAGRSLVDGETVYGAITHEIGHHIDWAVFSAKGNDARGRMSDYADGISGYAGSSTREYMAESFVAYMRGEHDILDPEYVRLLESKIANTPRSDGSPGLGNALSYDEIRGTLRQEPLILPKKEYAKVIRSINTNFHAKHEGKSIDVAFVDQDDGAYVYTFLIDDFDDYVIIDKRRVD